MKSIIAFLTTLSLIATPNANQTKVIVDRVEDGVVSIEVSYRDERHMYDVLESELNESVNDCDRLDFTEVKGKFYNSLEAKNYKNELRTLYQFRSNDNEVWWLLTEEEIGEVPSENNEYTLIYFDNGTTENNKSCDCLPEWDCECELYDDIFLGLIKN